MTTRPMIIVMLSAMLASGCAVHTPPARSDSPEYVTAIGQEPGADDKAGATAANIAYVPGRGLMCGAAGLMSGVIMVLTLGQSYDSASQIMHGACSGPWWVRPSDIRQTVP